MNEEMNILTQCIRIKELLCSSYVQNICTLQLNSSQLVMPLCLVEVGVDVVVLSVFSFALELICENASTSYICTRRLLLTAR